MRWLTNAPKDPQKRAGLHGLHETGAQRVQREIEYRRDKIIGRPKASSVCTVEELEARGYIGIYAKEASDMGIRFEIEGKGSDEQVVKIGMHRSDQYENGVIVTANKAYLLRLVPGKPVTLFGAVAKSIGLLSDARGRVLIEGMVPEGTASPAAKRVLAWIKANRRTSECCSPRCMVSVCAEDRGWNACLDALAKIAGGE